MPSNDSVHPAAAQDHTRPCLVQRGFGSSVTSLSHLSIAICASGLHSRIVAAFVGDSASSRFGERFKLVNRETTEGVIAAQLHV